MTEAKAKKWSDDAVAQLVAAVGSANPVTPDLVEAAAQTIGVTVRSVAAKLRQMEYNVASMAKNDAPTFSAEQSESLATFVKNNAGTYTYKQIAEMFPGNFSAKQVQGKLLALELTGSVKAADKVEVARTYTEAEEATFVNMAQSGAFIEDIATALGKAIPSVRGKALSLLRKEQISKIPAQKDSHAKEDTDPVAALGAKIASMTVADIAAAVDKTERGIKTLLTRRGIDVADYKGSVKKAKAEAKAA